MTNYSVGGFQFFADYLQFRGTDASIANAKFLLHQFDQLDELGNRIQTQQRQEPAIQFERLRGFSFLAVVEQVDGFARQSIGEPGDPSSGADSDAFQDGVVHADKQNQAIADESANRADPAHVGARFLYRMQILVLVRKLLNLFGKKIGSVRDRVIVQHAGESGGFQNGGDVGLHFTPVAFVN